MRHKDSIGAMHFTMGYATAIALIFEGEHLYHKFFAACLAFYLTWHILNGYEN